MVEREFAISKGCRLLGSVWRRGRDWSLRWWMRLMAPPLLDANKYDAWGAELQELHDKGMGFVDDAHASDGSRLDEAAALAEANAEADAATANGAAWRRRSMAARSSTGVVGQPDSSKQARAERTARSTSAADA